MKRFNHELQVVYGPLAVEAYTEAKEYLEKLTSFFSGRLLSRLNSW